MTRRSNSLWSIAGLATLVVVGSAFTSPGKPLPRVVREALAPFVCTPEQARARLE